MTPSHAQANFADLEPIVLLDKHAGISDVTYMKNASYWLSHAEQLVSKARENAYADGAVGEENELTFTQREVAFLIDGLQRISRTLGSVVAV